MNENTRTFDSFVTDPSNRVAVEACKAVAAEPGTRRDPLWLYGPLGCGKSHLLGAVCHALLPDAESCVVSAEEASDAMLAFMDGDKAAWRRLEACDVLVLENIDFWCGKTVTQEEIARLILSKCQRRQQVLMASECAPDALRTLAERLFGHAAGGVTVSIGMPSAELRLQLAAAYIQRAPFPITAKALTFLAAHTVSVLQLQGALKAARLQYQVSGRKVDLRWAKKQMNSTMR